MPISGQQHQLRANHDAVGQRQAARPPLKLTTRLSIKLDRCRRDSHAITFVNPRGNSFNSTTELPAGSTKLEP
ncbi:MAG: hypothetical protein M3320_10285 [Actinomycetota bacterium]|nr:hypothetical protein [Actinomycetota bacterium]